MYKCHSSNNSACMSRPSPEAEQLPGSASKSLFLDPGQGQLIRPIQDIQLIQYKIIQFSPSCCTLGVPQFTTGFGGHFVAVSSPRPLLHLFCLLPSFSSFPVFPHTPSAVCTLSHMTGLTNYKQWQFVLCIFNPQRFYIRKTSYVLSWNAWAGPGGETQHRSKPLENSF